MVRAMGVAVAVLMAIATVRADVVVAEDTTPFKVKQADKVRLTAKGISGGTATAKVAAGNATVDKGTNVTTRVNGQMPIGALVREFVVTPSGKGKVKVEVTVKGPQPGSQPETTTYEFTVE
jgi:autotransporter translocation and assembly factor TamB